MISGPRLSIGMPVFNGENYVAEALESLLSQTYADFELIISDNASTDATQRICESFAAKDPRVRYLRADKNHGASWNHARVIKEAQGELFKLAAHDDVCKPELLEKCVRALNDNPECVLAYCKTLMMQGDQSNMTFYQDNVHLEHPSAAVRFGDLIDAAPPTFPIFGVVRLAALNSIPGFDPYKASDRVVLTRLALMSPFIEIDDALFLYRWHDKNASHLMKKGSGFYTWWQPDKGLGKVYPETRLAWEHLRSIFLVSLSWRDRLACFREWRRWCRLAWPKIKAECMQVFGQHMPDASPLGMFEVLQKNERRRRFKLAHYGEAAIKTKPSFKDKL